MGERLKHGVFPVGPDERERLLDVWEASVRATHHFVSDEDMRVYRPHLCEKCLPRLTLTCVRDREGLLVGFCGVLGSRIELLFIHPDWRGRGAGRRLVNHARVRLGATEVAVNEQNKQALGFYLRMGFEIVARSSKDGLGKPYPILHMRLLLRFGAAA